MPHNSRKTKAKEPLINEKTIRSIGERQPLGSEQSIIVALPPKKDLDVEDEYPDGTSDILSPKQRKYKVQEWKKTEEINEFLAVYIYGLLEEAENFVAYYSISNENYFKCAEESCSARLKIKVESPIEEEEKVEKGKATFTSMSLKKSFDLKIPKLTVYRSNKHENHSEGFKEKIIKKLKGKFIIKTN